MACEKRTYPSVKTARLAHRSLGGRLRAYWCEEHHGWHVSGTEKLGRYTDEGRSETVWEQRRREREERRGRRK